MPRKAATKVANQSSSVQESREQLIEDLKRVIEDAQKLAGDAKDASGAAIREKLESARSELDERLEAVRSTGEELYAGVVERSEAVEELIRKHPWRSVAIAAAAGLLVDRLLLRR